jgi:hypothetical protein
VVTNFRTAFGQWGTPDSVLTDNGAILTVKQRGEGRVALEVEFGLLGVKVSHSRPYHPQTCGKVREDLAGRCIAVGLTPAKVDHGVLRSICRPAPVQRYGAHRPETDLT